jgi:hypothetical protein
VRGTVESDRGPILKSALGGHAAVALSVPAMLAVVVGMDVLFFRHQFWPRLIANVGVVLVFAAFYPRFRGTER